MKDIYCAEKLKMFKKSSHEVVGEKSSVTNFEFNNSKMSTNYCHGRRNSSGLEKVAFSASFCLPIRRSKSLPRMQRKKSVHWSDNLEDIYYFQPATNRSLQILPTDEKSTKKRGLQTVKPSCDLNSRFLTRRRSSLPITTKTKFQERCFLRAKEFHGSSKPLQKISEEREQVHECIDFYGSRRATAPIISPKDLRKLIEFDAGDWV